MKQRIFKILLMITVLQLTSCVSKKDIVFFQFDEIDTENINNNYQLKFKPDDRLEITISADNYMAVKPFNLPVVSFSTITNSAVGQPQLQSYLIDQNGHIDFPLLGKLKLGGLTRVEAIAMFKKKLSPDYIKEPIININISNFKITVEGDVNNPGSFPVPNERITIFDALGLAKGLAISANRKNILVIREENNQKNKYRLDLTSNKVLTSPVYYLQQNDVIYVEPNKAKMQDAAYTRSTGLFISLASVFISLITVLTR